MRRDTIGVGWIATALVAGVLTVPWRADVAAQSPPPAAGVAQKEPSPAELAAAIDKLGSFDLTTRTAASRVVRRASANAAVPALARAAREHADSYVRYRALVLLAGFGEASAADTMRLVMTDKNDRLRTVAYEFFEAHKDPAVLPALIEAVDREQSEFVRPALLRALAVYGDDARARSALLPYVLRGEDDFRAAVIEALGDYGAKYALAPITEVAKLDGPLQDESAIALGGIGDPASRATLLELQRTAPREVQPAIATALCLLGVNAEQNRKYLDESLSFGATNEAYQPLLRGAAHGLAVLAASRKDVSALGKLMDVGGPANDPARAPIALALGFVALRNPSVLMDGLLARSNRDQAVALLRDAFDMLASEDYALERFFVDVRHTYWNAPPGSDRQRLAETLIRALEF
jgi:HEAT repeat protein